MSYFDGPKIQNQMIIIFGATGELMKKKLLPALYYLYDKGYLSQTMPIMCLGREKLTKNSYLELLAPEKNIQNFNDKILSGFMQLIHYVRHDIESGDMTSVISGIQRLDKNNNCRGNKLIYLATPSDLFEKIVGNLEKSKVLQGRGWTRVMYEKPFGKDLESAKALNKILTKTFDESQLFRVDNYLSKELVQDIIAFRFANPLVQQIWNNNFVDNIQITVSENEGIGRRGKYYEQSGAIKDMINGHIMHLLALTAMEEPKQNDIDNIKKEKIKVFKAIQKVTTKDLVIGQYSPGKINGKSAIAYRKEKNVDKASMTETFAAVKLIINNKIWKGIPFYVKTGKRLKEGYSRVDIVLKSVACKLFDKSKTPPQNNVISIEMQPNYGLSMKLNGKETGSGFKLASTTLGNYQESKFEINSPGTYEMLIQQAMIGDQMVFSRWDEVENSWKAIEPLLVAAKKKKVKFPNYASGSLGPKDADLLIKKDKREWVNK